MYAIRSYYENDHAINGGGHHAQPETGFRGAFGNCGSRLLRALRRLTEYLQALQDFPLRKGEILLALWAGGLLNLIRQPIRSNGFAEPAVGTGSYNFV